MITSLSTVTHHKSTQLPSAPITIDRPDLRQLRRYPQQPRSHLCIRQCLHIDHALVEQRITRRSQSSDKDRRQDGFARIPQYQEADDDILRSDHRCFPVRIEGKSIARAVGQGRQQRGGLEGVGEDRDSSSGL